MAVQRKFISQLIVMQTAEYAGEIRAYATRANVPLSTLLRDSIQRGWPAVYRALVRKYGEITPAERLYGEVISVMPSTDRPAYEAKRGPQLLLTSKDQEEYAEIISAALVGAE